MIIETAKYYREQIIALLDAEKLPVSDLPASLKNFKAAIIDDEVVGIAGIEVYGEFALLRSVAVKAGYRNKGIAAKLVDSLQSLAHSMGVTGIYLLTETAPDYFKSKGFTIIERKDVPGQIQTSTEFSHICPSSAIVMKKSIQ